MYLAADIGGTKTLLALGGPGGPHFQRRYENDAHSSPEALIASFLGEARDHGLVAPLRGSCLALAGPVGPGARQASLTNRPWHLDADYLAQTLPLGPVSLLNDFAAGAAGISTLAAAELVSLQAGQALAGAPRLVVGPGTGLGVAALLPNATGQELVLPSEGGHVGFAPADAEQQGLLDYLRQQVGLKGHIGVERIVSGPGLRLCHRYCLGAEVGELSSAEITARALAGSDPACARALDLFLAIFGGFAGDMGLCFLAQGGVYLAGGIVPKVLPRLISGPFLAAFRAKSKQGDLLAATPVFAVLAEDITLRGALATACAIGARG